VSYLIIQVAIKSEEVSAKKQSHIEIVTNVIAYVALNILRKI